MGQTRNYRRNQDEQERIAEAKAAPRHPLTELLAHEVRHVPAERNEFYGFDFTLPDGSHLRLSAVSEHEDEAVHLYGFTANWICCWSIEFAGAPESVATLAMRGAVG